MSRDRATPPGDIQPREFFCDWAPNAVASDPERRKRLDGLDARVQFDLAGEHGGTFHLRIHAGEVQGGVGPLESPDLVLSTDVATWRELNAGAIKAPTAVMKGRLKFKGSMYLALRIHFIIG